jgi:phosphate acyltransferase
MFRMLKRELMSTAIRKAGAMLCKPAFRAVHQVTNADEYGGMPLLGVNGVCIIAHGGSSPIAIKNALRMAVQSIHHQVNPHIVEEVARYHQAAAPAPLA